MTDSLSDFSEHEFNISDSSNIKKQNYHPRKDPTEHQMLKWNVIFFC